MFWVESGRLRSRTCGRRRPALIRYEREITVLRVISRSRTMSASWIRGILMTPYTLTLGGAEEGSALASTFGKIGAAALALVRVPVESCEAAEPVPVSSLAM